MNLAFGLIIILLDPPYLNHYIGILVLLLNVFVPGLGFLVAGIISKELLSIVIGVVVIVLYFVIPISCYVLIFYFLQNNFAILVSLPILIGAFFIWLYSSIWVNVYSFLIVFQGYFGIFKNKRRN
jgi:hypothetical protein